jgi:hypothetical protein
MRAFTYSCIFVLAVTFLTLASAFDIPHIGSIDGDARPSVTEEILTPRTFTSWAEAFASKGVKDVLVRRFRHCSQRCVSACMCMCMCMCMCVCVDVYVCVDV